MDHLADSLGTLNMIAVQQQEIRNLDGCIRPSKESGRAAIPRSRNGEMLADDFPRLITLYAFGPSVPVRHASFGG
jgi:hypothetical protein